MPPQVTAEGSTQAVFLDKSHVKEDRMIDEGATVDWSEGCEEMKRDLQLSACERNE